MKLYYNVETAYENSGLTYYDFFSQFVQNDEEKFSPEQILTSIQNQTEFPVLNASLELHQLDRLSKREVDAVKQTIEATKSIVTKIEKDPIGKFLYDFKDGEERNYSLSEEQAQAIMANLSERNVEELPDKSQLLFFGKQRIKVPESSLIEFKYTPYYFSHNELFKTLKTVHNKKVLTLDKKLEVCHFLNQFNPYFLSLNPDTLKRIQTIVDSFRNFSHEDCYMYVFKNQKNIEYMETLGYLFSNHNTPLDFIKSIILKNVIPKLFTESTIFDEDFSSKTCEKIICETYFEHQLATTKGNAFFIHYHFQQKYELDQIIQEEQLLANIQTDLILPLNELTFSKQMNVSSLYTHNLTSEHLVILYPFKSALKYLYEKEAMLSGVKQQMKFITVAEGQEHLMQIYNFLNDPKLETKIKRHLNFVLALGDQITYLDHSDIFEFYDC